MHLDDTPSDTEKEIRLYLLDQLPPPEKQAVEARIAHDPDYALTVEEMRWMLSLAQVARHDRMQAQVQAAGARARSTPGWTRGVYLSAAAAVALLAAFGAYLWVRPPLGQRIFKEHFKPSKSYHDHMGGGSDLAFTQYDEGKYADAIAGLSAIPATDAAYSIARYCLAQAYLAADSATQAIPILEDYVATQTADVRLDGAMWYLAMAYLHENNLERAEILLEELELNSPTRGAMARDVLEALR
jgi:predicted Zn-dependent protease